MSTFDANEILLSAKVFIIIGFDLAKKKEIAASILNNDKAALV